MGNIKPDWPECKRLGIKLKIFFYAHDCGNDCIRFIFFSPILFYNFQSKNWANLVRIKNLELLEIKI